MKKDIIKKLGSIAGGIAKDGIGESVGKRRTAGDVSGNVTDLIIDHVTNALGGGGRGGGKGGGGSQGGGGKGGGGKGGGGGGRRCA